MNAATNRLLAAAMAALLAPWLEREMGIKLTEDQAIGLVGLAPVVYHALAAFAQKCVSAFVLYFPPPVRPTAPAIIPAKE